MSSSPETSFEVRVAKDTFKFNAAHFVAFQGFRERLHGHNYTVAVKLLGSRKIGSDGYVVDFGDIKAVTKKVCKDLNEHFLCPTLSNVMQITVESHNTGAATANSEIVKLVCEDGSLFVFPKQDCAMLPIVHATTEELAVYLWGKILQGLDATFLRKRGIHTMEITVAEAIGQEATFRYPIPEGNEDLSLDVRKFIDNGDIIPTPCLATISKDKKHCDGNCQASKEKFSAALEQIAVSINQGALESKKGEVTPADLQALI
jgi:dihydroneopterin triphosphate aldolase (PTPS-III) / 6-pyruvoyltetrahydropterin synthase